MSTNDPFTTPAGDGQQPAPMAPPQGTPPAAPVYNAYQQPYMTQANQTTNGMAIASLVCIFVFSPLALVFGLIALNQMKRDGSKGQGMAMAGVIVGGLGILVTIIAIIAIVAGASSTSYGY